MEFVIDPTRLYRRSAAGKLQFWEICAEEGEITIEWGYEDGYDSQIQTEHVEDGLAGRTLEEQVMSRVNSRINGKLDGGYVREKFKAIGQAKNVLGLCRPMLAKRFQDVRVLNMDDSALQYKYDGHRCLVHRDGDNHIIYSRRGRNITTLHEIEKSILESNMPPGTTLDGELYLHGASLQRITSLVKRRQPMSSNLIYVIYDIIAPGDYEDRLSLLKQLHFELPILVAPTYFNVHKDDIPTRLDRAIEHGYEGLILRQPGFEYEDGKRSNGLIKIKKFLDAEFVVRDIVPSREGYAILICKLANGLEFRATAPGTMDAKTHVLEDAESYIGRIIQVKYANLTEDGKPFHPIATQWL